MTDSRRAVTTSVYGGGAVRGRQGFCATYRRELDATALPLRLDAIEARLRAFRGDVVKLRVDAEALLDEVNTLRADRAIADLAALPPSRDAHGGAPISAAALRVAAIMATEEPARTMSTFDGIQLEWHTDDWDIEIELVADVNGGVSLRWLTANAVSHLADRPGVQGDAGSERSELDPAP